MKKMIALLLVLVMLLSLCACGKAPEPIVSDPTVPQGSQPSGDDGSSQEDPTDAPSAPASHTHNYSQEVTDPDCVNGGYTTYTCDCGDTYQADEVAALGHSWVDATCTTPKTCSVCAATEGEVGAHNYQGGQCASCGAADPSYKALTSGNWVSNKLAGQGLAQHKLSFGAEKSWSWRYFEYVEEPDPEFMEYLLSDGTMLQLDGKYYQHMGMGEMGEISFTESGDTITVTMVGWDSAITLQRISGNQVQVTALSGQVNVAMAYLAVGDVYTWAE